MSVLEDPKRSYNAGDEGTQFFEVKLVPSLRKSLLQLERGLRFVESTGYSSKELWFKSQHPQQPLKIHVVPR